MTRCPRAASWSSTPLRIQSSAVTTLPWSSTTGVPVPLEVVQPDSIDLDEASGGRVPALDLTGVVAVVEGGYPRLPRRCPGPRRPATIPGRWARLGQE